MRPTQLLAELLVVGAVSLLGVVGLFYPDLLGPALSQGANGTAGSESLRYSMALQLLTFGSLSYFVGYLLSVLSELAFSPLKSRVESWYLRERVAINLDEARYQIYTSGLSQVVSRLEYHRAFIRLSRSLALALLLFMPLVVVSRHSRETKLIVILILFVGAVLLVLAYARRAWWFTKTTYLSWVALDTWTPKRSRSLVSGPTKPSISPESGARAVLFAGGTASREISRVLARCTSHLVRVVPVYDNGGSSQKLRQAFKVLPVGDIRHALIALAPQQGPMRPVVRLCNWRLSDDALPSDLAAELDALADGAHPLMRDIEPDVRAVLAAYIATFRRRAPRQFDLSGGSIGNFVLVGAYLAHEASIATAIFNFRKVCGISAQVLPVSLENNLHLAALLEGVPKPILGQARITKLNRAEQPAPIDSVFLTRSVDVADGHPAKAAVNPLVIEAISQADIIVYGPGSFFTSVLPHILTDGVVQAVARASNIPKVLLTNLTVCEETEGLTHEALVEKLFDAISRMTRASFPRTAYVTHILVNRPHDPEQSYQGKRYLPTGDLRRFSSDGILIVEADLEDSWLRHVHDAEKVVELMLDLL